jgi:hydrogenase maturation protease
MRDGPLIVGLGNPLNGDAGVGARILELLAMDDRLPEDVELVSATPEFVRQRDYLKGRTRVILLDAFLDDPAGEPREMGDAALRALDPGENAPGSPLSARHALDMLEQAESELLDAELSVVGVAVGTASPELRPGLSDPVEAGAQQACTRVIEALAESQAGR